MNPGPGSHNSSRSRIGRSISFDLDRAVVALPDVEHAPGRIPLSSAPSLLELELELRLDASLLVVDQDCPAFKVANLIPHRA